MRILILEDDPLIAFDLQLLLEDVGHEVVGPFSTLADAAFRLDDRLDFAFLDIDLPDGKSFDLASELERRRIPFTFVSASMRQDLPPHLRHARFVAKPYQHSAIRVSLPAETPIAC